MAITLSSQVVDAGVYRVSLESGQTTSVRATSPNGDSLKDILSRAMSEANITNVALVSVDQTGATRLVGNVFVTRPSEGTMSIADPNYIIQPGATIIVNRPKSNG